MKRITYYLTILILNLIISNKTFSQTNFYKEIHPIQVKIDTNGFILPVYIQVREYNPFDGREAAFEFECKFFRSTTREIEGILEDSTTYGDSLIKSTVYGRNLIWLNKFFSNQFTFKFVIDDPQGDNDPSNFKTEFAAKFVSTLKNLNYRDSAKFLSIAVLDTIKDINGMDSISRLYRTQIGNLSFGNYNFEVQYLKFLAAYHDFSSNNPAAGDIYLKPRTKVYDFTEVYSKFYSGIKHRPSRKVFKTLIKGKSKISYFTKRDEYLINYYKNKQLLNKSKSKGNIKIIKELEKFGYDSLKKIVIKNDFALSKLSFEIADGCIFSIIVSGIVTDSSTSQQHFLRFINMYPIPFSTLRNMRDLAIHNLYCIESKKFGQVFLLNLADVMDYIPNLNSRSYDYSPQEMVYNFNFSNGRTQEQTLYKEPYDKVLTMKVYSDFVGVLKPKDDNESQPNGLIQTEISKKVALNQNYMNPPYFLKYIEPVFVWSKIENNDKQLNLDFIDSTTSSNYDASMLDIYQHSNFKLKVNLNALWTFMPRIKTFIEINGTAGISNTLFGLPQKITRDSSLSDTIIYKGVNYRSLNFGLNLKAFFRIDPRWGIDITTSFFTNNLISKEIKIPFSGRSWTRHQLTFSPEFYAYLQSENRKTEYYFKAAWFKDLSYSSDFLSLQVGLRKNIEFEKKSK